MAEEQQQSKGIGELFVEFGAKGLPTLLKGLNTVSASFLLTKNAAQQLIKPVVNFGKEAGNSAVGIAQLSATLGTTFLEAQKFQLYFKKYNLNEGLLGDLASTADMLTKVQMGIGGISGEFAYAMNRMGLNWQDYDGSIESTLQLLKDVQQATSNMPTAEKRIILQSIGWNPEWLYAFEKGINLNDALTLDDSLILELEGMSQTLNDASSSFNKLKNIGTAKIAPVVEAVSDRIIEIMSNDTPAENRNWLYKPGVAERNTQKLKDWIFNAIPPSEGTATGGAAPIVPPVMQNGHIPPNLSNTNTNITVNNENKVTVANPQDAGRAINSINQETLTNINYSGAQILNNPGL